MKNDFIKTSEDIWWKSEDHVTKDRDKISLIKYWWIEHMLINHLRNIESVHLSSLTYKLKHLKNYQNINRMKQQDNKRRSVMKTNWSKSTWSIERILMKKLSSIFRKHLKKWLIWRNESSEKTYLKSYFRWYWPRMN